ncbi:uncharacterized protein [Palaemon carinicauda]|uniref:uncharacterized protein n=1 Tax=Palaemon carinicauda TaxID=392227 RepID=UPI0035B5C6C4
MTGDQAKCEKQCLEDSDCPPLNLCCPNGCGRVCVSPKATRSDECGCSVTFLTQTGNYYDYYDDYFYEYDYYDYPDEIYYIYNDYADREEIFLLNFIWESLQESFTPSLEPYVVNPNFIGEYLGPQKTLCQLRKVMESDSFMNYRKTSNYDIFRKKNRKLFIVTKRNETLERIGQLDLRKTYTTICLITIGNVEVPGDVLSQLTPLGTKLIPPLLCQWSVDSYQDLQDLAPSIKEIINDGECLCPGESGPTGPCVEEGGSCTTDDECGKPTQICDRGVCKKQNCFQPKTFEPEPDTDYDFYMPFYDDPIDSGYYSSYNNYYHSIDYYAKEYDDIFYDDIFYTDFEASSNQKRKLRESEDFKSNTNINIIGSKFMQSYNTSIKSHGYTGVPDKFSKSYSVCCMKNYFQCSGVPTMCLLDIGVCDGTPDCPLKDDESEEACAKRVCGEGWFECKSGGCIRIKYTCDGIKHCIDGSDEYCKEQSDCPPYRQHLCQSGECISHYRICDTNLDCRNGEDELACNCFGFRCKSGECISNYGICNNVIDCFDGSDEDCLNLQCPAVRPFKCNSGQCISQGDVCDGFNHCSDLSDERLELCSPQDCYFCPSGKCISKEKLCDGYSDCEDGKDESDCTGYVCGKKEFKCQSGECLRQNVLCNGREECVDGSDESSCSAIECPDSRPIKCSSGECISHTQVCNGVFDCIDKSDESKCLVLPCRSDYSKCLSGECVYTFTNDKCDGYKDCKDGSDEMNCETECQFTCKTGECLSYPQGPCNGYRECPDGSDEEDCEGATCLSKSELRCNSGECIYKTYWCDGNIDCRDGSDELNCEAYSCKKNYFKCTSGECVFSRCDGYNIDCKDGSDEKGCKKKCWGNLIHCKSGECMDRHKFCDGYAQCFDGSDEKNCADFKCPFYRPFKCGSGECRRAFHRCDGFVNCADGSDEINCTDFTCPPERPFSCQNGICITYYQVCNGYNDCGDGSDERDCSSFKCPETTFPCENGKCISYYQVCDDLDNCGDGSDETNCDAINCPASTFQCKSGKCLPPKLVCDKNKDCPKKDDEVNCPK